MLITVQKYWNIVYDNFGSRFSVMVKEIWIFFFFPSSQLEVYDSKVLFCCLALHVDKQGGKFKNINVKNSGQYFLKIFPS